MKAYWRSGGLLIILCALIALFIYFLYLEFNTRKSEALLSVSYLDVGQGDATFVESPTGTQMLIDGGRDATVLAELAAAMGYFDRTIDVVVATHPDADHIGGLIDVLERYKVKRIVMTNNVNDTPAYEAFMRATERENADIVFAYRGQVFDLGGGEKGSTTLSILFPDRDVEHLESNTSSIIGRLSYGDADFLFTGDSPEAIETYLVGTDQAALQSEVLKAGHHGSRTSSHPSFVEAVRPRYAIISAGKDNDYGHPHKEVLDTFAKYSVQTKNTADEGSIFLESDGALIWIR